MPVLHAKCIRKTPGLSILVHILVWGLYIIYEITLAGAISGKFAHFIDYLLHYSLYIGLFYFHCYRVLIPAGNAKRMKWVIVTVKVLLELLVLFCMNILIHLLLKDLDINSSWSASGSVFVYSNIYRGILILGASTGYWLILEFFKKTKRIHKMQYAGAFAEKEKEKLRGDMMKAEIDLLKSQINPHMLFNTLNFIYNEVRKIDKPVADHILSLSELMRFSLTGLNSDEKVYLIDELEYIEHYISLHCMRLPSHIVLIKKGLPSGLQLKIIPLILATIVENILQHGDLSKPGRRALLRMTNRRGHLTILSTNKIKQSHQSGHGIGLVNMERRLKLAYPNSHILEHGMHRSKYTLKLTINLN